MEIEVRIFALTPDYRLGSMLVFLREASGEKILPVWIGMLEGSAILMEVENVKTPRPLTHDLLKNVLSEYAIEIEKVVVTDIIGATFYAILHTKCADRTVKIDARPSDAIALALRFQCPIFVESHVFEKAKFLKYEQESEDEMYERMLRAMDAEKMPKA